MRILFATWLKTLLIYLVAFFCIICISYIALQTLPGDPILRLFADYSVNADTQRYEQLQIMYGYQHGIWDGFYLYCKQLLHGNLGFSSAYSAPVSDVISQVLPWTWLLTLLTAPLVLIFSYFIGIEAAVHHGGFIDILVLGINNFINAVPSFVKAVLLFFLFLYLFPHLPLQGAQTSMSQYHGWQRIGDIFLHLIAPVSVLFISEIGKLILPIRATALTILARPYVTLARLRGLSLWRIRHAYIGNNIKGVMSVHSAMLFARLLSGSIFVETVFSYPGIGLALFQGITYRDYALVQGIILLLSAHILLLNFISDISISTFNRRG